jgi:hypothetical protein
MGSTPIPSSTWAERLEMTFKLGVLKNFAFVIFIVLMFALGFYAFGSASTIGSSNNHICPEPEDHVCEVVCEHTWKMIRETVIMNDDWTHSINKHLAYACTKCMESKIVKTTDNE